MKSHIHFSIQVPGIGTRFDGTAFLKGCVVSGGDSSPPRIKFWMELYRLVTAVEMIQERRLSKRRAASQRYRDRKRARGPSRVQSIRSEGGAAR